METFVVEIAGEPVMAFRAEDHDEAQELVHGDDSERGGVKTTLLEYEREDGQPLWDGASELTVRAATGEEHHEWEAARDAAIESDDDPDDFDAHQGRRFELRSVLWSRNDKAGLHRYTIIVMDDHLRRAVLGIDRVIRRIGRIQDCWRRDNLDHDDFVAFNE